MSHVGCEGDLAEDEGQACYPGGWHLGQPALHWDLDVTTAPTREPQSGLADVQAIGLLQFEKIDLGLPKDLVKIPVKVYIEAVGGRVFYGDRLFEGEGLGEQLSTSSAVTNSTSPVEQGVTLGCKRTLPLILAPVFW